MSAPQYVIYAGVMLWASQALAACPEPNPNLLAPPFIDGCPLPAAPLNNQADKLSNLSTTVSNLSATVSGLGPPWSTSLTGILPSSPFDNQVASFLNMSIGQDTATVQHACDPLCTGIPTLAIDHKFGGPGTGAGGRQGLWVNLAQVGNMTNPNAVPFHTGIFSNVQMASGTSDGSNVYAFAGQMADNVGGHYVITGGEIDISANAPTPRVEGWSVAAAPLAGGKNLFGQGGLYSAGYGLWVSGGCGTGTLSGGSGCGGFSKGFSFGRDDGYFPVGQNGTMIGVTKGVGNMKADWGIRFVDDDGVTPVQFKFCAFRSQGMCIDGSGNYQTTHNFPAWQMEDSSITTPVTNGGLMRFTANGGSPESWQFQINTAAAGDFSTTLTPLAITNVGAFAGPLIVTPGTPASSSAPCFPGQIQTDATFIYTCVAVNTWHRVSNGSTW